MRKNCTFNIVYTPISVETKADRWLDLNLNWDTFFFRHRFYDSVIMGVLDKLPLLLAVKPVTRFLHHHHHRKMSILQKSLLT